MNVIKESMHHVGINVTEALVLKNFGQGADDSEAQLLPQGDGVFVGTDDKVVLYGKEAGAFCLSQTMPSH